ncbi:MAG: flagellar FlbD family protein [Clostridiales bacterium]|nr:flagellar FlbD family protein [Clostridiales bacterium]
MIELTKMNQEKFYLNPNLIEEIEMTPDRLVTTMSGKKFCVLEPIEEIIQKIDEFYSRTHTTKARKKRVE